MFQYRPVKGRSVVPQRVTDALLQWLGDSRLTPLVVVHVNHPAELDAAVGDACRRMQQAGITVLNQAVLLKGINDTVRELEALSNALVNTGVMSYYLHQLDRVAGAAHFEVDVERGLQLVNDLRQRLPGYMVPRFVQEVPGAASKHPLG